jgi:hypothetical protein
MTTKLGRGQLIAQRKAQALMLSISRGAPVVVW